MHIDFQRVKRQREAQCCRAAALHQQASSPAGKSSEVVVTHELNEVQVVLLPKDLPEFIEVDPVHWKWAT
uniref:hypothetical protein n=1 Tax=Massilia oculi TaxID=945844 RepID=UPI0036D293EC